MKSRPFIAGLLILKAFVSIGNDVSVPTVTRREAALIEKVEALARTNAPAAVMLLRANLPPSDAGAALPYTLGGLLTRTEHYSEAVEAYRRALEIHPEFEAARIGMSRALALGGEWASAETALRRIALSDRASEDVLLFYGHLLLRLDRLISAESIYRRAALAGGDGVDALHGLAQCFMRQERYGETAALAAELVRRNADESSYWALWADALMALERPRDAAVRLEAARRLGAATPAMLSRLADLYLEQELFEEARECYEWVLEANDLSLAFLLRAAEGLTLAGATRRAGAALERIRAVMDEERAEGLDPSLWTGYWRIKTRWAGQAGETAAALEACRKWVERDPLNVTALLELGDRHQAAGDSESAILWYERAARVEPDSVGPLLRLARLAGDRDDHAGALEYLEKAHRLSGDPALERTIRRMMQIQELRRSD